MKRVTFRPGKGESTMDWIRTASDQDLITVAALDVDEHFAEDARLALVYRARVKIEELIKAAQEQADR